MLNFSAREVVEQAIQTEKLGREYYTKMAEKFQEHSELKKLFDLLAIQETKHESNFTNLKGKLKEEDVEGWDEVAQYLSALVDSEFFLGKESCLPSLEHVKTAAEAIDFALCFERETLLYYHTLKETLKEKEIMEAIVKEERSHIVWLNNLKKSFA